MSFIDSSRNADPSAKKRTDKKRRNEQRIRLAVTLGLLAVVVVFAIDGASIVLTKAKAADKANAAGYAAVRVTQNKQITEAVAEQAYERAQATMPDESMNVARQGIHPGEEFSVDADGAVTLTVVKQAPTILMGRIGYFDDITRVAETYTQAFLG